MNLLSISSPHQQVDMVTKATHLSGSHLTAKVLIGTLSPLALSKTRQEKDQNKSPYHRSVANSSSKYRGTKL